MMNCPFSPDEEKTDVYDAKRPLGDSWKSRICGQSSHSRHGFPSVSTTLRIAGPDRFWCPTKARRSLFTHPATFPRSVAMCWLVLPSRCMISTSQGRIDGCSVPVRRRVTANSCSDGWNESWSIDELMVC